MEEAPNNRPAHLVMFWMSGELVGRVEIMSDRSLVFGHLKGDDSILTGMKIMIRERGNKIVESHSSLLRDLEGSQHSKRRKRLDRGRMYTVHHQETARVLNTAICFKLFLASNRVLGLRRGCRHWSTKWF